MVDQVRVAVLPGKIGFGEAVIVIPEALIPDGPPSVLGGLAPVVVTKLPGVLYISEV
jgi:hypothetical protein